MKTTLASKNAHNLIRMIRTGELPMETLPNSSPNYTYAQERYDTDYYINVFLNSSGYDFIKKNEGVVYNGE